MATAATTPHSRASEATYVYGVTRPGFPSVVADGVAGGSVVEIAHRGLAAVAGRVPQGHVRARRRDLLAHTEVLQQVFARNTVVPLRFGTVLADDESVVDEFLAPRYETLTRLLDRLDGLAELSVRAYYDEDAVLREIVRDDTRVARLKARGAGVDLGAAVAASLNAKRAEEAERFVRALAPHARDVVREEIRSEYELLRASFLVEQRCIGEFDSAVDELARSRRGVVTFKYVGPLPPHSFADLEGA
jgi:gas vesicle protein GvpL/GvpF